MVYNTGAQVYRWQGQDIYSVQNSVWTADQQISRAGVRNDKVSGLSNWDSVKYGT